MTISTPSSPDDEPAPGPPFPGGVVVVASASAMRALGEHLAAGLRDLASGGAVVALDGELGAGKTVLVQGIARGLGLSRSTRVTSPTFTLLRSYAWPGGTLHHVDAYRLRGVGEWESSGLEETCGPHRVTCVEWAERIRGALPEDRLDMDIRIGGGAETPGALRRVFLTARGSRHRVLLHVAGASGGQGRA